MKKIFIIGAIALTSLSSFSQEDSTLTRATQVSFIYPIGTNGVDATKYTNNFSFNVLYGLNGGLNGVEIGGLVNSNIGAVNGAQFAGIANINGATAHGFMGAGIANVIKDSSNSISGAGIANVCGGNFVGLQMAGIANAVKGDFLGGQMSGIANFNHGDFKGAQLSGIANTSTGNFYGLQGSGIANFVGGDLQGAQVGLVNRARKIKGFQLGLINVANDFESGVPLGLISYVKNGYHAVELAGGDAVYGNLNFKLGVEKLYNIYKIGFAPNGSEQYFTYGLGLGSKLNFTEKFGLSIEGSASHIVHQNFNPRLDMLNKLDVNFRYALGDHFDLFAGPSFNVYLSQHDPETESSALNVPYSLFTHNWGNGEGQTYMWLGANAGICVNF